MGPSHCELQILSHPSQFAVIPDDLKTRVKEYGHGLLSPWSPQQTILRHPVSALTGLPDLYTP